MADTLEKIKVVNSAVRTAIIAVVLSIFGYSGCVGYNQFIRPGQEAQEALAKLQADYNSQTVELNNANQLNKRLQTSLKLLKIDRRMANVKVVNQGVSEDNVPFLDVEYVEVSQSGSPIGQTRPFHLKGDKLYLDCWIVQFDDKYIEAADPMRNASLCVMKSIWGDLDGPSGGFPLDQEEGQDVPAVYLAQPGTNDFEKKIWSDFWGVCNDPAKQKELGIRASHGQVNYMKVETGKTYQVEVRASGGASFKTLD